MSKINKITVVTASYNAEAFIEDSINSVIDQNYPGLEYIIIDGGSKDNTVNVIKKYSDKIDYWISERDKGIYDAWNKGVQQATGDWIMFIGCDDKLVPNALKDYNDFINTCGPVDYISSKKQMIDVNGKPIRIQGWAWEWPKFLKEMTVAHPASLHSKKMFETYGKFDTNYRIVGDYEFLLRPKDTLKAAFMDKITVIMAEGGASDTVAAIKESYKAATRTGNNPVFKGLINTTIVLLKHKTKYFFRRLGFNVYLRK